MAKIEVIQPENAEGFLKEVYDELLEKRGKVADIHKIQSLNPQSIVNHMDLYLTIMFGQSPLSRPRREMIGVIVSKANNCEYCQIHHSEALLHYWKNEEKVKQLREDYHKVDISQTDLLLGHLAWHVTKHPGEPQNDYYIDQLALHGLSDRAILDATLVISYFNFVNRMVLTLGVELEAEPGGYIY
ncbi:peroxidase-related enzyme [Flexithrix dorotheae]|uniref:peroxidase-related enzyme n=1 Tax=Flexithrix dorotheae TaxID=70993 RepID=UPI00036F4D80|nr:peroxidase-related enzyme [Flexithrix dorotheae]